MATFPQGFKVALLASDKAVRDGASAVLTACSYKVTPAGSVEECLQLCTVQRIDIVLAESVDLTADKEKTMKLMAALKNVPLIVMSDADASGTAFHGMKIGAVDFLKRPLDKTKVRSMWQHTLQKRMSSIPAIADETVAVQRTVPSIGSTEQRRAMLQTTSEGSSNEKKESMGQSPMVSSGTDPLLPISVAESAQIFVNEPTNAPLAPTDTTSVIRPSGNATMSRRPAQKLSGEKRRIQSNLPLRETTASCGSVTSMSVKGTSGMVLPPLLGIPPGCIPPVGGDGLAIGMPFLNQHPFVPSAPMNMNTFGFVPPFTYNHTTEQEMMGVPSFDFAALGSLPMPNFPPPTSVQIPTNVTSTPSAPRANSDLQRVASTPVTVNQEHATSDPGQQESGLFKSPSVVNF